MKTTLAGRACVLALATAMAAQPVLAQELIRTRPDRTAPPPAAPAPTAAPVAPKPAASPVTNTPVVAADELPAGAPSDDYEFLGWCTGVLTGHMELYSKVKPELDSISKRWNSLETDGRQQAQQQAAGKELLLQFRKAMGTVEAASATPISFRGQTAIQKGLSSWTSVDKLDKQNQAYAWMNFGLPGRCENKAAELEKAGGKTKTVAAAKPTAPAATVPLTGVTVASSNTLAPTPTTPVPKPAAPAPKTPSAKEIGLRR